MRERGVAGREIEIAGYLVDTGRPVAGLVGGGLAAFAARPARGDNAAAFAVRCRTQHPPRLRVIERLPEADLVPNLLVPLGQGMTAAGGGEEGPHRYILYPLPPGPPMMTPGERRARSARRTSSRTSPSRWRASLPNWPVAA